MPIPVIGHEQVKRKLYHRLSKSSSGTFLFYGPPSVGKRTTAFEIAKRILCLTGSWDDDCFCASCRKFDSHPDFICTGRTEKIRVDDIDTILDFSQTAPFLSNKKVIILDNADVISIEAANRLLKILEEPPKDFSFILVSSYPQGIISTILSRCVKYEFGSLSREDLTNILWKKMGFGLPEARILGWVASNSSLDVFSNAGKCLQYKALSFDLVSGLKKKSLLDLLELMDKIEGSDFEIFINMVIVILTDLLLIKNKINSIVNEDILEELKSLSEALKDKSLMWAISIFNQIKKYGYLNINYAQASKNALIKIYPAFVDAPT